MDTSINFNYYRFHVVIVFNMVILDTTLLHTYTIIILIHIFNKNIFV